MSTPLRDPFPASPTASFTMFWPMGCALSCPADVVKTATRCPDLMGESHTHEMALAAVSSLTVTQPFALSAVA